MSNAPTALVTITNQRDNGALDAACYEDPPSARNVRAQLLAFTYNLYLTDEGLPKEAVPSIELQLHSAISRKFLTCQYEETNLFDVVTVSSSPKDWATDVTCDTSKDPIPLVNGTVCVVVNAGIQLFVYFSSPIRHRQLEETDASPAVLDAFEEFLRETMAGDDYSGDENVVQLSFQGFGNVPESPTNSGGTGGSGGVPSNPDGTANGLQEGEDGLIGHRGGVAVGSTVLAVAAACLVLVVVLVLQTKRRSQDSYAKYLDDASLASGLSDDPNCTMPMSSEGRVRIHVLTGSDQGDGSVWCEDVDYDEREAPSTPPLPNRFKPIRVSPQHDVRTCSSATCPVCRDRSLAPIFLSLHDLELESELVPMELGPRRFDPDTSRNYKVSDTIRL
jgi:hypothetical protein